VGWVLVFWLVCGLGVFRLEAELQFDVFLGYGSQPTGYDGQVREAGWFSMGCEVYNDGAGFDAVVEVRSRSGGGEDIRRVELELPSGTRKRFSIPVFSAGRAGVWDVRLLDSRGRERAKYEGLRPRVVLWEGFLMGTVARTYAAAPRFPELGNDGNRRDLQPVAARMQVEMLPDQVVGYEGMDAVYLSSERALEMGQPQVDALLAWVEGGGHLVMVVEQAADVNATPWLRRLVPAQLGEAVPVRAKGALQRWLMSEAPVSLLSEGDGRRFVPSGGVNSQGVEKYRYTAGGAGISGRRSSVNPFVRLEPDLTVDESDFLVVGARLRDGARTVLEVDGRPWIFEALRGRGYLTVLLFSPEREPFRGWKQRDWFWVRLLDLPWSWFDAGQFYTYGGESVDGVYGLMIDSRQVQKLPVKWLLLLLVVYLLVIGPVDQMVLKRLNRQMLTWLTFPAYVVLFSLLIYYIGYRLRAGETEWNELHVVDVVDRVEGMGMRGRTYASLYSPVNDRYALASDLADSTLRGEYTGSYGGGRSSAELVLNRRDTGFDAEVYVPVWTSQLMVWEWSQLGEVPLGVSVIPERGELSVMVTNNLAQRLEGVAVVQGDRYTLFDGVEAGGVMSGTVRRGSGLPMTEMVFAEAQQFQSRVNLRQQAFGSTSQQWLDMDLQNLLVTSFLGLAQAVNQGGQRQFIAPSGVDLSEGLGADRVVVLVWVKDYGAVASLRRFKSSRVQESTLYRWVVPVGSPVVP
jgi:hypothetical protein